MAGGTGVLAGVAFDDDGAAHHVFGHTRSGRAFDMDRRLFVHTGAVVARGAVDRHFDRGIKTTGDRMRAFGVFNRPDSLVGGLRLVVQRLVQRP